MQFVTSLPEGLPNNAEWRVIPRPSLGRELNQLRYMSGESNFIVLEVQRDSDYVAKIQVTPHPKYWVAQDPDDGHVFHIFNATAVFLERDEAMLGGGVAVVDIIVQNTDTPANMSAGHVVLRPFFDEEAIAPVA